MPGFIRDALHASGLAAVYDGRPPYQSNDYFGRIMKAKLPATRQERLAKMLGELAQGDVCMKMAWRRGRP